MDNMNIKKIWKVPSTQSTNKYRILLFLLKLLTYFFQMIIHHNPPKQKQNTFEIPFTIQEY
jgi:hypothetical protein